VLTECNHQTVFVEHLTERHLLSTFRKKCFLLSCSMTTVIFVLFQRSRHRTQMLFLEMDRTVDDRILSKPGQISTILLNPDFMYCINAVISARLFFASVVKQRRN